MKLNCPGFTSDFDPTVMFKRILVPVDFGLESRRALVTACVIKQQFGSEIHVFHLTAFGTNDEYIRGLGAPWTEGDVKQVSDEQIRMFGESICKGMPCSYHKSIVGDDLVKAIADAADACNATMVIMPVVHPGRTIFRSRSERIARAIDVPILFVKGHMAPESEEVLESKAQTTKS
jgi:nucleotide-binding universal stress UspA family protein